MDATYHLNMETRRGVLKVEGQDYRKELTVPSCRDILKASVEQRKERLSKDIVKGNPKMLRGQEFIGYTTEARTMNEVNVAYAKIRSIHTESCHIIAVCRLPGRNFHTSQDFQDDGEHGAGQFLLNMMIDSGINNCALFVVRNYDGTHLGPVRFEMMKSAAKSALDRAPINSITGNVDNIWTEDKKSSTSLSVRGGGQGKAVLRGQGHGANRVQDHASSVQHQVNSAMGSGLAAGQSFAQTVRLNAPLHSQNSQTGEGEDTEENY